MTKKELRSKYKQMRQALSDVDVSDLSLMIACNVNTIPIWGKTYFHLFLPIIEFNEVNTEFLLVILAGKDKEIVISKTDFQTRQMTHFLLTDNTKLKKNRYNISEPVDGLEVPSNKIEVVFVPLLAFDSSGHRVGYGKGFYDKFLAECKPGTIKVGLSFFEPVESIDDIFEGDIPLNYCVTPDRVYDFD